MRITISKLSREYSSNISENDRKIVKEFCENTKIFLDYDG